MIPPHVRLANYKAALEEAVEILGRGPEPSSAEDERLDVLLHEIRRHPPAFRLEAGVEDVGGSMAQLAQLRAHVEAFVRRRAEREANNAFPHRQHGVGPTLGQ